MSMNCQNAINGLIAGHVVRRTIWDGKAGIVRIMVDGKPRTMVTIRSKLEDGQVHWQIQTLPYNFFDEDIYADDWELA